MRSFTMISKITKKGEVKVCIVNQEDSYPLCIRDFPITETKKYYTVCTVEPSDHTMVSLCSKSVVERKLEELKSVLKKNDIRIDREKTSIMYAPSPSVSSQKKDRSSCPIFTL